MRHKLKKLLIKLGIWRFVRFVYRKFFEKKDTIEIEKLIKFYSQFIKPDDLCFDVGAYIGDYTEVFNKLGAKVVAIEPQPHCVKYLKKRFKNNPDINIIGKGLADKAGELEFYICEEADTVSTFSREYQNTHFKGYNWNKKIKVSVTTLDALIEQFGLPDYCKIDVEGFEYQVLKGLTKPIPLISIEDSSKEMTEKCINYLTKRGYKIFLKRGINLFFKYGHPL
jgi:FkbM family methyltransferase